MKKLLSLPIAATLVTACLFPVGCKKTAKVPPPQLPHSTNQRFEDVTPYPHESGENSVPAPVVSEFWDTSDVDISSIDLSKKHIAFTFDDAPNRTLEQIVAVFTEFNQKNPDAIASATVFYNGVGFNEASFAAAQAAYAVGFETGNHTYSHFNLCDLDRERLRYEIEETDKLLKNIDGKPFHLLRAPYGSIDERVREESKTPILDWSVDTLDWTGISAQEICEKVYAGLEDGGIVLMHDGAKNTVEALKILLPELKARGYQITGVSQLAKIHDLTLKRGSVYTRARKR